MMGDREISIRRSHSLSALRVSILYLLHCVGRSNDCRDHEREFVSPKSFDSFKLNKALEFRSRLFNSI